ncbi:M28 family peptidase [Parvularcula lutaonensis]|uniref:Carboxypeptidase Q n=1 Tax=Parvularcula lutaonensis TaxID=491923 RepID=A0ABV7M903_9PROT|nr:M28 family peptidase [Parvularcula lutaonensis]GGY45919.1 peptidase M28 [Parvularcula lutaonensis]
MKSIILAAAASLSVASAQGIPDEVKETADFLLRQGLEDRVGYQTTEDLTTEVGARLGGSEAEARARDWAVEHLEELGFSNVRIEEFTMPYWARDYEYAAIAEPFPQELHITALGNSVGTPEGGLTGEIVRFETLDDLIEAPMDNALRGKIVFVDEGMTRTQDGSGYGVAVRKRSGAANEGAKRGAIAALIRSVGTDEHRFPHTGGMRYEDGVRKIPTAALSFPDAEQLQRALERGPVSVTLDMAVETKQEVTSGNVIAEIPGQTDEIVVIGGHLDSWDLGTGAVDDGAGIGITTGAAKLILDHVNETNEKPLRTIRLVYWGAEEVGLLGARAYAEQHRDELSKHAVAAESDFGAREIWKMDTRFGEDKIGLGRDMIRVLAPAGVALGNNQAGGGPDVTPLRAMGVPVVTLRQNGWDYFDLHHTADDTFDKIDPDELAQNVAVYAAFTWMAANTPGGFRADDAATPSE